MFTEQIDEDSINSFLTDSKVIRMVDRYALKNSTNQTPHNGNGNQMRHPYMTFIDSKINMEKLDYYYSKDGNKQRSLAHDIHNGAVVWKPVCRKRKDQFFTGSLRSFNRTSVPGISLNKIESVLHLPEP